MGRWQVGVGLAQHTAKRRWNPTPVPKPHPDTPKEICEDNDKEMVGSFLPGCSSFATMGYCKRFPPLAHHYCRLSCAMCTPPNKSSGMHKVAKKDDNTATMVKGSGIIVSHVQKRVLGHQD